MLEEFFKVLPSHIKIPPDHYKAPQVTSKGHTPLLIPIAAMRKCKPLNFDNAIMVTRLLIIHDCNWPDLRFKVYNNCCSIWYGLVGKANGRTKTTVFFGGGGKILRVVLQCVFGRDFLSPRTAIVSGIKNYPSASSLVARWSSTVAPCLDL